MRLPSISVVVPMILSVSGTCIEIIGIAYFSNPSNHQITYFWVIPCPKRTNSNELVHALDCPSNGCNHIVVIYICSVASVLPFINTIAKYGASRPGNYRMKACADVIDSPGQVTREDSGAVSSSRSTSICTSSSSSKPS